MREVRLWGVAEGIVRGECDAHGVLGEGRVVVAVDIMKFDEGDHNCLNRICAILSGFTARLVPLAMCATFACLPWLGGLWSIGTVVALSP